MACGLLDTNILEEPVTSISEGRREDGGSIFFHNCTHLQKCVNYVLEEYNFRLGQVRLVQVMLSVVMLFVFILSNFFMDRKVSG